jgi:hypothetical protein
MTSRESVQAKVRAIIERANHPNTPQAEAETALALALRLMTLKTQIYPDQNQCELPKAMSSPM